MRYDVLIVGGSFAGLSAALQLARARRKVCVVDAGAPRNRFAAHSHGFFGQDGMPPLEMIAQAREKVLAYPSVDFVAGSVEAARADDADLTVVLADGTQHTAARLLLAFGVHDSLPPIDGLRERWGVSVLHCPYCHGYEFADRRLGVLYDRPLMAEHSQLIAEWGPTTLFMNGSDDAIDEALLAKLRARGVTIEPARIAALEGPGKALSNLRLSDGRSVPLDALYVGPRTRPASPLATQLGCAFDEGPAGPVLRVDAMKMTTVPGVYAAGDAALMFTNATMASADGVMAGVSVHRSFVFAP